MRDMRYCLPGRAKDRIEQMRRFVASGVRGFILAPLGQPAELLEISERTILPALRSLAAGRSSRATP